MLSIEMSDASVWPRLVNQKMCFVNEYLISGISIYLDP